MQGGASAPAGLGRDLQCHDHMIMFCKRLGLTTGPGSGSESPGAGGRRLRPRRHWLAPSAGPSSAAGDCIPGVTASDFEFRPLAILGWPGTRLQLEAWVWVSESRRSESQQASRSGPPRGPFSPSRAGAGSSFNGLGVARSWLPRRVNSDWGNPGASLSRSVLVAVDTEGAAPY